MILHAIIDMRKMRRFFYKNTPFRSIRRFVKRIVLSLYKYVLTPFCAINRRQKVAPQKRCLQTHLSVVQQSWRCDAAGDVKSTSEALLWNMHMCLCGIPMLEGYSL